MGKKNLTEVAVMLSADETIIANDVFKNLTEAARWALSYDMHQFVGESGTYNVEFTTGRLIEDPNLALSEMGEFDLWCNCHCDGQRFFTTYYVGAYVNEEISLDMIAKELKIAL